MAYKINLGCGSSPTEGYQNFDNSPTVWLANAPVIRKLTAIVALFVGTRHDFLKLAVKSDIRWADCRRRIPLPDGSVEVLYTSHMIDQLNERDLRTFISEALRVMCPGGILRIAVTNLRGLVDEYMRTDDADQFVKSLLFVTELPSSLTERCVFLINGFRNKRRWIYDENSLVQVLSSSGFSCPVSVRAGTTTIGDPGLLNLSERHLTSLYVEAKRP